MLWMYVRMLVIILKVLNLVYSKLIKDVLIVFYSQGANIQILENGEWLKANTYVKHPTDCITIHVCDISWSY